MLEQEPVQGNNPLLALPQGFVSPHAAGQKDLTIEGTAVYVAEVIGKLEAGEKMTSLLNEPKTPRRALGKG